MDIVWSRGAATVRDVADELEPVTDSAYTTIMTLMLRLSEKGLLSRKARGRAFVYAPRMTRDEYDTLASRGLVRSLIKDFGDVAIAQFAQELQEVDPERARQLGELLRRERKP